MQCEVSIQKWSSETTRSALFSLSGLVNCVEVVWQLNSMRAIGLSICALSTSRSLFLS